jgi:hypothetical protein
MIESVEIILVEEVAPTKEIAIEKFLEAEVLGVYIEGFFRTGDTIFLNVYNSEDENHIPIELAAIKQDYTNPAKVYSWKDLCPEFEWAKALFHSSDLAIEKVEIAERLRKKLIRKQLEALENL